MRCHISTEQDILAEWDLSRMENFTFLKQIVYVRMKSKNLGEISPQRKRDLTKVELFFRM